MSLSIAILLLLPILFIQLTLQIFALVDLSRRKHVAGGNKLFWALFIILGNLLGAAAYLLFGRRELPDE
ncbi:MAG: PLDc_N domain-containing protein [Chloroflexi bacterium]|nr:PLDc_N domain-containing protein [Chloroflexota bacterium]